MYYKNNRWKRNHSARGYKGGYNEPPIVYLAEAIFLIFVKIIYFLLKSIVFILAWAWGKIIGRKKADINSNSSEVVSGDFSEADKIAEVFKPILDKNIEVPKPTYFKKHSMLTIAESNFYRVLDDIAKENNYVIQTKVRLEGLVGVHFYAKNWFGLRNRIKSREMDFVICEKQAFNLYPILVIELDDSSHSREDRVARDKNLDDILRKAGLPILHMPVASSYNPVDLLRQIKEKIRE